MLVKDVSSIRYPIDRLVYWIKERESIRRKRKQGFPKPWTDDAILQNYRFCNIRRVDDKVSQWLLNKWYLPYKDHRTMLLACALARFINLPATLQYIGFPYRWEPTKLKSMLRQWRDTGHQVFNGAYMVRCDKGIDKISYIIDTCLLPLYRDPPLIDPDSFQKSWLALKGRYGFGSFMAGQVVADLRWAITGKWKDTKLWAPAGPGSIRGLNRIYLLPVKASCNQQAFDSGFTALRKRLGKRLPKLMASLEAIDIQNCLCEFDKYERTLLEGRRPKARYPGAGN